MENELLYLITLVVTPANTKKQFTRVFIFFQPNSVYMKVRQGWEGRWKQKQH